jgi:hypothetical protein
MSWGNKLKEIAKNNNVSVALFLALSPKNDPFYIAMKAQIADAQWIAKYYRRRAKELGTPIVYARRLHYYIASLESPMRPNGTPYENTDACWNFLVQALKNARYLGLIPMENVEDHKNKSVQHTNYWSHENIEDVIKELSAVSIAKTIADQFYLWNEQLVQPYHLEIWIEKDSMDDKIEPLAKQYGLDVVTGEGEISLTQVYLLMAKALTIQKPIRIFYISDYDPKGKDMPVSIARKIEWFVRNGKDCDKLDIKLKSLMLTPEQCIQYNLLRKPIKTAKGEGTGAKAYTTLTKKFEDKRGAGATELDALESQVPGEFSKILENAIKPYIDEDAQKRIYEQNDLVQEAVRKTVMDYGPEIVDVLQSLDFSEARKLYDQFKLPTPKADVEEGDEWLLDSKLDYTAQLKRYIKFKNQ